LTGAGLSSPERAAMRTSPRRTSPRCSLAAGSTIKEIMVFMGHADPQTVDRSIKLLPRRDDSSPVDRLDSYLRVTFVSLKWIRLSA
jgi:hypothetical protein